MKNSRIKMIVGLFIIFFLSFSIYVGSAFYIKNYGIELATGDVFDHSQDVKYFLQTDQRWANNLLGNSNYTLAQQGCTVTDVAMLLNYIGYEVDPGVLNDGFTQNGLYDDNGNLLWFMIEDLYPVEYKFRRVFYSGTIENDLEDGVLPIVRVKYGEGEFEHWVLVVGSDGSDFLVMDPLNKNKTLNKLREYGKVYAYRAILPKGH